MNQVVFLEVGELSETLGADVTLERPFSRMRSEVDLEIAELTECLVADVTFVVHLAILLFQRIGKAPVASRTWAEFSI